MPETPKPDLAKLIKEICPELKSIEWSCDKGDGYPCCHFCHGMVAIGHDKDCKYTAIATKLIEQAQEIERLKPRGSGGSMRPAINLGKEPCQS